MKNRTYQGIKLCKRESELIEFLQTGSNDYTKAFFIYKHRRQYSMMGQVKKITSWFNRTLKGLQDKSIALNIPFVWEGIKWSNPGIESSKANLVVEEKQDQLREIVTPKKII